MHFSIVLFIIGFSTALNTTKTSITTCTKHSQCLGTHFCNIKQHVCLLKRSINGQCEGNIECSSGKCHEKICRKPCKIDNDCSLTKEYCSNKYFCTAKHCGFCTRDAQCANKHCRLLYCVKSTCIPALAVLRKQ